MSNHENDPKPDEKDESGIFMAAEKKLYGINEKGQLVYLKYDKQPLMLRVLPESEFKKVAGSILDRVIEFFVKREKKGGRRRNKSSKLIK